MTEKKLRNIAISGADHEKINLKALCKQILLLYNGKGGGGVWRLGKYLQYQHFLKWNMINANICIYRIPFSEVNNKGLCFFYIKHIYISELSFRCTCRIYKMVLKK